MVTLIGVVVSLLFLVLWGGGLLQELGRPRIDGDPAQGASDPLPASGSEPEREATRLQVFEDYLRSLPDDDGDRSGPAAI